MKNLTFFFIVAFLSTIKLSAQFNYNDYNDLDKTSIFYDDFSNNSFGWFVGGDGLRIYNFKDGYYELISAATAQYTKINLNVNNGFSIDQDKDFELESSIMYVSGEDNNANQFFWGQGPNQIDRFMFGISGNGQYVVRKCINNTWIDMKAWTPSALLKQNDYNKLTVRKVGNDYYFFINESFVCKCPFERFYGQQAGWQSNQNSTIRIDFVKFSYLKKQQTINNNVVVIDNPVTINEKRLALVIGNSNYGNGQTLKNPANDANLISNTLQSLGFDVIKRIDANKQGMEQAIREFSKKLPNCNVALFYYAGHGIQVDGMNYIIPTDAQLNEKSDCKFEAISVNYVVEEFEKYPDNVNIVILDACRNDPFRSWARGGERGFKAISPTSGTIISFATSEGSTASDGAGNNGLFTEELVKQMSIPQPIENVFKKTRVQVQKRSNGGQNPQEWSQLTGDFYFTK